MLTKNEIAEKLIAKGIALPPNWGKLSTARAQGLLDIAETVADAPKPGLMGTIGKAIGGVVASVVETIVPVKSATPDFLSNTGTMPRDPNWKRRQKGTARGWYPSDPVADPEPMTRQVRRQNERREQKMPIGARQEAWHRIMGFGKIGAGKRRKGEAA